MTPGKIAAGALLLIGAAGTASRAAAPQAERPAAVADTAPRTPEEWRQRTRRDLTAFERAVRDNYIYAVYPDPAGWRARFDTLARNTEADIPLVHDEGGYEAVLRRFAVSFHDAHVGVRFTPPLAEAKWPGFLARLDGDGSYRITDARAPGVADGAVLSSCDGRPAATWVAEVAEDEIGLPTALETTRTAAALRLFVDRGSPLRPRPARCVIDGREVALDWTPAPSKEIDAAALAWRGFRTKREVSTRPVGTDGAWVRLGYFQPQSESEARAFDAAVAAAPGLRDKRFIVLDVRGNGGGPYNWFMAYLRGLYGPAYADHYATARLRIRGVYRLSPAAVADDKAQESTATGLRTPADPPFEAHEAEDDREQARAIKAGEPFYRAHAIAPPDGAAPPDPVRASVYVLTDGACGSACIGFVDELKLFPGVRQIGLPTFVDSRSGTPLEVPLPSGGAVARVAVMTRDGRLRDDNAPQTPSVRYPGDPRDDAAVERWAVEVASQLHGAAPTR